MIPQVSVVVPIYNVEKWLPACLDSLLNQTLGNWEAVLVDDGSTDASGQIADAYAARDARFKVIHQKNTGLGGARNTGCRHVTGDYLYFLDSDDLLPSYALQGMHNIATQAKADMVVGDFYTFIDGQEQMEIQKVYPTPAHFTETFAAYPKIFTWRDLSDNLDLLYLGNYFCVAWAKLFRIALWKELQCESPENLRMAEDFIAVKKFAFGASRITTYPQAALLYRKRSGSATTRRTLNTFEVFRAYTHAQSMFREAGVYDEQYNNIHAFFLHMFIIHMRLFTPQQYWLRFYRQMYAILSTWDASKLSSPLSEKVLRLQKSPVKMFIRLTFGHYIPRNGIMDIPLKLGYLKKTVRRKILGSELE